MALAAPTGRTTAARRDDRHGQSGTRAIGDGLAKPTRLAGGWLPLSGALGGWALLRGGPLVGGWSPSLAGEAGVAAAGRAAVAAAAMAVSGESGVPTPALVAAAGLVGRPWTPRADSPRC